MYQKHPSNIFKSGDAVTSVGIVAPGEFVVSNSPVVSSGNISIAWQNQSAGKIFASPALASGVPTFRSLVSSDLPLVTGVAGVYTNANITVDIYGRVSVASSGTPSGGVDLQEIQDHLQVVTNNSYSEFTYTNGDITKKEIWNSAAKTTKYYTLNYNYSGGDLASISITRESDSFTFNKVFNYSGGNLTSITVS